jgi:hypothetical protein
MHIPYVHVRVFQTTIRANGKTLEEYIINAFSYTLRETTSNWCHYYISKKLNCIFKKLYQAFCKHNQKTHNDEQILMELKNIKQGEIKWVEVNAYRN